MTCSVLRRENEDVVAGFIRSHADFKVRPVAEIWRETVAEPVDRVSRHRGAAVDASGFCGCSHRHNADGFFVAVLEEIPDRDFPVNCLAPLATGLSTPRLSSSFGNGTDMRLSKRLVSQRSACGGTRDRNPSGGTRTRLALHARRSRHGATLMSAFCEAWRSIWMMWRLCSDAGYRPDDRVRAYLRRRTRGRHCGILQRRSRPCRIDPSGGTFCGR